MAEGLAVAHGKGVVHRDIKPGNLFLCSDGRVKILDFGLASLRPTVTDEDTTMAFEPAGSVPGTVMGTVGYMAPEQVRGEPADHRSDIFSLGCVLYEMLVGRRPFQRDTSVETMTAILREELPPLSESGLETGPGIEETLNRCVEKDPHMRPFLGYVLVKAGATEEAHALLGELESAPEGHVDSIGLAWFRTAIGDLDGAMASLELAYEVRNGGMPWIGSWIDFSGLLHDPRFQDLLERMNLAFVRPSVL